MNSTHVAPLTGPETRAALHAVTGVLDVARDQARRAARPEKLADILDSAHALPDCLTRAELFRDRFRPTLARLAGRYVEFAPVLTEFDRATAPPPATGRDHTPAAVNARGPGRSTPEDDLWVDCGAAD